MNADRIIGVRNDKTVLKDGEDCIKVFNVGCSGADVINEALNQARAREVGINAPIIKSVENDGEHWKITYEYVEGKTLDRVIAENPEKKDEYLELLVDLQIGILSNNCPQLSRLREKLNYNISESELEATVRYDLIKKLWDMPRSTKLCHGDFNPTNIIIKEDGTPYIIDWAQASRGNASADVARTYIYFLLEGDKEFADKYAELYCKKTGTSIDYVLTWVPIVAGSLVKDANEREKDFLISVANTPEYK